MSYQSIDESLQQEFTHGTLPKNLEGFYKGELTKIMPGNMTELIGSFLLKLWLPWRGKYFYAKKNMGENLLPLSAEKLLRWKFGINNIGKKESNGFHAFPFKTSFEKGSKDNIKVLRLDYDLIQNPQRVRMIVDELVEVGKNSYLGKAYIVENNDPRLVAFFRLRK